MIPDNQDPLATIRQLFESLDPMPSDLPERIRFSLALHDLDAEVARLTSAADELALTARGAEESRTITFDSDSLTIMIRIDSNPDGSVRVDGWLAPPKYCRVEIRTADNTITMMADEAGRFVFPSVPHGTARLVVRPPETSAANDHAQAKPGVVKSVITPALVLLGGG